MGDINGHNTLWGSQQNNYRGNKFANFINKSNLTILNSGEPTHQIGRSKRFTHIDLTLSSPEISIDLNWSVYTDRLRSNHFPIILNISRNTELNYNVIRDCIYKTNNIEWENYTNDSHVEIVGNNISEKCHSLEISILSSADRTLENKSKQ